MSQKIKIIFFMVLFFNTVFCQEFDKKYVLKVDCDAINDSVIHHQDSNIFEFKYSKKEVKVHKKIFFFKNYNKDIATINVRNQEKRIVFELTFAPKYLDKEILSFEYDKAKDNWILKKIETENFNPMNSEEEAKKCVFKLKKQVLLEGDFYEAIQEKIQEQPKDFFLSKSCK